MKKILIALTLLLGTGFLAAPAHAADISGTYWAAGTNPGGQGQYKGIATIVKAGDVYRVHWEVGTVYDGVGKLIDKTFAVDWGTATSNVGTVTYTLQPDGSLKGTWSTAKNPSLLGTEILTPKK